MADLVVSYLVPSRTGTPYGHRIWADGNAESYQVSKPVRKSDGSFEYQSIQPDFYPVARLSPQQVEAVRSAVETSGLAAMPTNVRTRGTGNTDSDNIEWQVTGDDGVRTIRISPWPPANDEPEAALSSLINRIGTIILAAQSNSLDAPA